MDTARTSTDQSPERFDPRSALPSSEKSNSEETRRAYRRVVREFFHRVRDAHPRDVTPADVLAWRDSLIRDRRRPATVAFKLSVVRSFFEHLRAAGHIALNPAAAKLVPPPPVPQEPSGRALTPKEVRHLLAGPDRSTAEGARDYALLCILVRLGLRVTEACSLRASSIGRSGERWTLRLKVKGGRERVLPLPTDVRAALDDYLRLDRRRREQLRCGGPDAFVFQPHTNYRTLEFDKPLSARMARNVVTRWADFSGVGKVSPHDLRRTAITRALDLGLTYRQVQMMSGHRDPKTVMRYDHGRENLDRNAINFLSYDEP